jgi:hypothetical protein
MSCKQVPFETLMRLADGELRGLKALTVRRHLKRCPECTQTLSELGRVDTLLKSTDYFPTETRQKVLPLRPIGLLTSVALAAGAALFFAIPGGPLRPTPSFAQVEAAMGRIHTAHWTYSITYLNGKKQGFHSVMDCWVDLDTHRLSYRKIKFDPINPSDGVRMDQPDLYVDEKAHWSVDHGSMNTYIRMDPLWTQGNKSLTEYLRRAIIVPQEDPQRVEVFKIQGKKQQYALSVWKQSDAQWKGQQVLKYTRTITFGDGAQTKPELVTVWIDPKTMRLLQRDTRQERDSNPQLAYSYNTTSDNFRYNETPPPGTFDLPVPKVGQRFTLGKAMETPQLQKDNDPAVAALARQVMECFSHRDADKLFSLWDTEGVPAAEWKARQDNWRRKLASPAFGKSLAYESSDAYPVALREFVRKSETEPFPPQPLPCRDVTIKGWLTMEKAPHPYLVFGWARFIQRAGQWRIQDLHELEENSIIKKGTIVMQRRYKK